MWTLAPVLYELHVNSQCVVGHETKAMLNNNGPRYKRSKLEKQMNVDVGWCVIILLVMCLFSAIGMYPIIVPRVSHEVNYVPQRAERVLSQTVLWKSIGTCPL